MTPTQIFPYLTASEERQRDLNQIELYAITESMARIGVGLTGSPAFRQQVTRLREWLEEHDPARAAGITSLLERSQAKEPQPRAVQS